MWILYLILGFGLHWRSSNETPNTYRRADSYTWAMTDLFQKLQFQGTVQLLIHRETSAEHYDGPGGDRYEWYHNYRDPTKDQYCQPLNDHDVLAGWRKRSIAKAAQQTGHDVVIASPNMPPFPSGTGRPEVVVLPYFDFTARTQSSFHPYHGSTGIPVSQDCMHWCSAPFLYVPSWRSLRLAMDRQFGND